jgi:hypothetical protein
MPLVTYGEPRACPAGCGTDSVRASQSWWGKAAVGQKSAHLSHLLLMVLPGLFLVITVKEKEMEFPHSLSSLSVPNLNFASTRTKCGLMGCTSADAQLPELGSGGLLSPQAPLARVSSLCRLWASMVGGPTVPEDSAISSRVLRPTVRG